MEVIGKVFILSKESSDLLPRLGNWQATEGDVLDGHPFCFNGHPYYCRIMYGLVNVILMQYT